MGKCKVMKRKKFSWKSFPGKVSGAKLKLGNKINWTVTKTQLSFRSPAGSLSLFVREVTKEQMSCPCCSFCIAANGATHRCCQLSALCRTQIKTNYCLLNFSVFFLISYHFPPFSLELIEIFLELFSQCISLYYSYCFTNFLAHSSVILWYPT